MPHKLSNAVKWAQVLIYELLLLQKVLVHLVGAMLALLLLSQDVNRLLYLVDYSMDIYHVGFRLQHCADILHVCFLLKRGGILLLNDAHIIKLLYNVLLSLHQIISDPIVSKFLLLVRFKLALKCIELQL